MRSKRGRRGCDSTQLYIIDTKTVNECTMASTVRGSLNGESATIRAYRIYPVKESASKEKKSDSVRGICTMLHIQDFIRILCVENYGRLLGDSLLSSIHSYRMTTYQS